MTNAPRFLFVANDVRARAYVYRVLTPSAALRARGYEVTVVAAHQLIDPTPFTHVILQRCGMTDALSSFIRQARKAGARLIFDVDDLVVDTSFFIDDAFRSVEGLTDAQKNNLLQQSERWRETLDRCDLVLTPTQTLRHEVEARTDTPAAQVRNTITPWMLDERASQVDVHRRFRGEVLLGVSAGTRTHDADIETIEPALDEVLRQYPDTKLAITGPIRPLRFERDRADRVMRFGVSPHREILKVYSRADVNLIALDHPNAFCDSKSPLKFFESAVVGRPSIATSNPVYTAIAELDDSAIATAHGTDEWMTEMVRLIEDADARRRIGRHARRLAMHEFHPDRMADDYERALALAGAVAR